MTRKAYRLFLVLLLTAAMVGMIQVLTHRSGPWLAARWQEKLAEAPDEEVEVILRQLAQLGEDGVPTLVDALGSSRESIAVGARQVLGEELQRWRTIPPAERLQRMAVLAESMAAKIDEFQPDARRDAVVLATQVVQSTGHEPEAVSQRIHAWCQQVLRTPLANHSGGDGGSLPEASASGMRSDTEAAAQYLGSLPGASPGAEVASESDLLPKSTARPPAADAVSEKPQPFTAAVANRPLGRLAEPGRLDIETGGARRIGSGGSPARTGGGLPGDSANDEAESAATAATVELMRRLATGGRQESADAEVELQRLGFRAKHLELARQLFDPDPAVRLRLARALPEVQNMDAAPWLLQLSGDENADVRLAAIGLLATTSDPQLLARVQRIARNDSDPRVQRYAERTGRERR
ncbi:MAG: HEAT repeat domain-containing protein [Thermoguttaceae bacterium]